MMCFCGLLWKKCWASLRQPDLPRWYHRQVKRSGDPDLTKEEAQDLHKARQDIEKPKPDNKGKQDGFVDPNLLEWLITWPIIPSELGCSELDCNHNGIPDHEEENQCK